MHGDPSAPAGPQNDGKDTVDKTLDQAETVEDVMNRQMKSFQNEKGGVLINWFKKEEERATFEPFPTNSHHDLFTVLQNITPDKLIAEQIALARNDANFYQDTLVNFLTLNPRVLQKGFPSFQ